MSTVLFAFLGTGNYSPAIYAFGAAGQARTRFVAQAMMKVSRRLTRNGETEPHHPVRNQNQRLASPGRCAAKPGRKPWPGRGPEPAALDEAANHALGAEYSELLGAPVTAQIISFGATPQKQAAFVSMVASHVEEGDIVHFDVTHGLRHLPMLALVAALAVRTLRNEEIAGVCVWRLGAFKQAGRHSNTRKSRARPDAQARRAACHCRLAAFAFGLRCHRQCWRICAAAALRAGKRHGRRTGGSCIQRARSRDKFGRAHLPGLCWRSLKM